ncbi:cell division protein FtsK [Streptomyces sp. 3MP-14]|uniref:Cell division protein FtsK n=1 Tax=Streptomyces mimosae TaxID=2586635 RepID=A0A5N6ASP4_9ACTN|nr:MULTISPECIES: cell division protein FtsK [Streptomyces]KAB8171122.1 cell division protein FtsK [Streptomyces mimosae]KAB8179526.1 cell division protein FtsK [Streptomyces sp. 3MP-14]
MDHEPEKTSFLRLRAVPPPAPESAPSFDDHESADDRPPLADRPDAPEPGRLTRLKSATRRPIRPDWMRSKAGFLDGARWLAGHVGHTFAFHTLRFPVYLGRLLVRCPSGAKRTLVGLGRWARDAEGMPLREAAARREDTAEWLRLSFRRDARVRWRGTCLAVGTPLALVLLAVLAYAAPPLVQVTAVVAAVAALGATGAPADAPLTSRAVIRTEVAKLTSDIVVRAMAAIGITQITNEVNKGRDGIRFVAPITREGPGWRADIDLPLGVTVADVIDRRARLASGLRRPLGCVWPDPDPTEHEGRLVLWVGDRDLSKTGPVKWPLAAGQRHDVFQHIPFGIDPRGRPQSVPLIQHNVLVGSLPGQGKTATVRVLACGAALDPTAELWIHENKGTGDLDALEPVCRRFVSGLDDESIQYAADSLALLRREVERRVKVLKSLPRDLCPDKRITRAIADRRSLRLWPLVAVFDECQNVFLSPRHGKQAAIDAEFVIKLGRALGVVLVLSTQRPDKDSLPTGVSGNVSIRFCLKVAGQTENDMVLGTSMYKNGVRATQFRPEIDAGTGYLAGATTLPTVVRTAYLDDPATARIAAKAIALRRAAGTLDGEAIGDDERPDGAGLDVLADLLAVIRPEESKVWTETALERLGELRPSFYGDWPAEQLTAALKPFGISTVQVGRRVSGKVVNRRGLERARLETALTQRDEQRAA